VDEVNTRIQQFCAWCGPALVVIWIVSFVVLAGFIPPPAPGLAPEAILAMFQQHTLSIRLGLIFTMFASALLVPWSATVAVQMARMEGRRPVLAVTQVASGTALSLEFIVPIMMWQTAAYRPDQSRLTTISVLNDMGWLIFVGAISSVVIQALSLGVAILAGRGEPAVFPRWSGYLSLWAALLLSPAGLVPLFHDGPFAWNGVFAFWAPLGAYCVWMLTMSSLLLRAINSEHESDHDPHTSAAQATTAARDAPRQPDSVRSEPWTPHTPTTSTSGRPTSNNAPPRHRSSPNCRSCRSPATPIRTSTGPS
jgi:hypothetical protein